MTAPTFGARARAWSRRAEVRGVFLIWVVLTALLCLFSFVPARLMGAPASPTKQAVETTMTLFTLAASPVAAFVWAIAIYSLVRWRHRGKQAPTEDGPAIRTNTPASALWVVVSSVLCLFLLVWGFVEVQAVATSASASDAMVVDVTGQQWVWTFSYPQEGNLESDQLYLPVNRPVIFHVTSKDVIHSFWVVQMGIKVDANPGETTQTSVTPDRLGRFDIRCAELCGLLHADMETSVHVVSPTDFRSWLRSNGGPG
ncbi:MAG: cytochrome c oxidase, subunit [Frankiales bacterium]|jgi:cytochrome c oxidase subunit 2|nr:cytochrome c oxidase, subunit [Frankiales bacterium]